MYQRRNTHLKHIRQHVSALQKINSKVRAVVVSPCLSSDDFEKTEDEGASCFEMDEVYQVHDLFIGVVFTLFLDVCRATKHI